MRKVRIAAIGLLSLLLSAFVFAACSERAGDHANLSNYTITAVFDDTDKTLTATETIEYRNNYDVELSDLALHLYPAAYREGAAFAPVTDIVEQVAAFPNGRSYGGIEIRSVAVNGSAVTFRIEGQDQDILVVPFAELLLPERVNKIEIAFKVTVPNMRHRFGWSGKTVNLGNFYPIACVYEQGAWVTDPYYSYGDPFYSESANYTVTVTAPAKYTAAMSGKISPPAPDGENVTTSASITAARDFAVVLGEFNVLSGSYDGIDIHYYYYSDTTPELSLAAAVDSVKTFSEMFGKYPYSSFSTVETAFLHGGMEYPGLTYISDEVKGELYREVIIHEAAHQWWYAVVGNNQVSDAWIDEALAEYSTTLFYEKNPGYNVSYNARIADALGGYTLYCDRYKSEAAFSTVMQKRLPDFRNSLEYMYMTYVKGQIMLDSLRASIGDAAFMAALKSYYTDNMYKISTPELLVAAFENASQRQLAGFFASWTDGKTQIYAS